MSRLAFLLVTCWLGGCAVLSTSYSSSISADEWPMFQQEESADSGWLTFRPKQDSHLGVIFYPGGKVEPEAYGLFANNLAARLNAPVFIVPMPLNLAVLGKKRALDVQAQFPETTDWLIVGHSLGGTMAADLVFEKPDAWQGLILLGSYPQASKSLRDYSVPTITFVGDADGLISLSEWQGSLENLPQTTVSQVIPGGNHAGFGHYGPQKNDHKASISSNQQQLIVLTSLEKWANDNSLLNH